MSGQVAVAILIVVGAVFMLTAFQRQLIYHPETAPEQALLDTAPPGSTTADYLFPQYQATFIEAARVPEPGVIALLGAAAGFGVVIRARRHRETV